MSEGSDKPAILQDQQFVVSETWPYRLLRGASIQLNRLMFASLILLAIWLVYALAGGHAGCTQVAHVVEEDGAQVDAGTREMCSVWLSPTTTYLATVAILSFVLSIAAGLGGLVVGKRIVAATPAAEEVGARRGPE